MRPGLQLKDLIFWSVIAFAWTGPEAISFMGGEISNPRRTVPLGLAIAAPAIAIIYIVGTLSVLASTTPDQSTLLGRHAGMARSVAVRLECPDAVRGAARRL